MYMHVPKAPLGESVLTRGVQHTMQVYRDRKLSPVQVVEALTAYYKGNVLIKGTFAVVDDLFGSHIRFEGEIGGAHVGITL